MLEHATEILQALQSGVLLVTKDGAKVNAMTISWGALGIDWRHPVFKTFVRESRFTRGLLDKTGVYADYSGVNKNGQNVGGRVHVVCIGKKLYVLELSWPKAYTETYKDTVYKQFRHSVKITK